MPPDSVGGFPPYYVRVIFLNVVIAWPYVARFCVFQIFGEVSGNNGATQCPWLGLKFSFGILVGCGFLDYWHKFEKFPSLVIYDVSVTMNQ